jgi:hypothetical protein
MANKTYTKEQFIKAVQASFSIRQTLDHLGLSTTGQSYRSFYKSVKEWNVDYAHFSRSKWRTSTITSSRIKPIEEYLILYDGRDSNYPSSGSVKKRLYKESLKEPKCELCNITEWNGFELSFHLDHINGQPWDNRLENLRIVCPNCHSQTETYGGKNKERIVRTKRINEKRYNCINCNDPVLKSNTKCIVCHHRKLEKIIWPDTETLIKMVKDSSYAAVARNLGVSDNAVRKRIKNH